MNKIQFLHQGQAKTDEEVLKLVKSNKTLELNFILKFKKNKYFSLLEPTDIPDKSLL